MARYYDIDKLKELVEAKADTLIEGKEAFLYVAKWLDLLPTVDIKNQALGELKKQVHDKAVYPYNVGVDPYINLKVFDAILNNLMRKEN